MKTRLKRLAAALSLRSNPNYWKTNDVLILVYNPSKVGSSTVYFTLKENLKWVPISHLHYLNRDWLARFKEKQINNWKNNNNKAEEVYELLSTHREKRVKIITLVRDPIALQLSSVFQGWKELFSIEDSKDLKDDDILEHLHKNRFDWLQTWYTKEFLEFTGIDVVNEPFDQKKGYHIYTKNNMDVLLIKLEDLNRVRDEAIKELLGVKNIQWVTKNTSSSKSDISDVYSRIKEAFKMDTEKLDLIYNNPFMCKFYSHDELNAFREKWQA